MLDTLGILLSTIVLFIVVTQAVRLDRVQAWFQTISPKDQLLVKSRTWTRGR